MAEKSTSELDEILKNTHSRNIADYLSENKDSFISEENDFSSYMRYKIKQKGLLQQEVFLNADIPEKYGYKLISEEKHTKQRDIILRICYASKLTLEETQKALRLYGMAELYSKVTRDAVLMICFNERPGSILEVNTLLMENQQPPLRTSGIQE